MCVGRVTGGNCSAPSEQTTLPLRAHSCLMLLCTSILCPCLLCSHKLLQDPFSLPCQHHHCRSVVAPIRQTRAVPSRLQSHRCSVVCPEPRVLSGHSNCCRNAALLSLCSSSAAASRTIWSFTQSARSASANFGRRIWLPTTASVRCSRTLRKCSVGSLTKRIPWREQEWGLVLELAALDEAVEAAETLEERERAKVAEEAEATISATTPTRKTAGPPGVVTQRRRISALTTPLHNPQRDAPLADTRIHPPRGAAAFRLSTLRPPLQLPLHLPRRRLRHTRHRHACH